MVWNIPENPGERKNPITITDDWIIRNKMIIESTGNSFRWHCKLLIRKGVYHTTKRMSILFNTGGIYMFSLKRQRKTKRVLCLITLLVLIGPFLYPFQSLYAQSVDPYELNKESLKNEDEKREMYESSVKHGMLLDYFKNNSMVNEINTNKHTYSGLYSYQYPAGYGGAYIGSTGKLVVLVKEGYVDYVKEIQGILGSDDFLYRFVPYSYCDLLTKMDDISFFLGNADFGFDISYICVNDYYNCVDVYLYELSDITTASFHNTFGQSSSIRLLEDKSTLEYTGTIYAGASIYTSDSSCSAGFRCTRPNSAGGTDIGFVTVRHSAGYGASIIADTFATIGTVTASYASCDASFVKITNSNYEGSNYIGSTGKILYSTSLATITQGATVYKYGKTTNETYGTIVYSSSSYSIGGNTYYDAILSTYSSDEGDSGGVVYSSVTSTYQMLVGMTCAHNTGSGYSWAAKAYNIIYFLGLSRY